MALPVALLLGFIGWGTAGVASVAFAYALILINFVRRRRPARLGRPHLARPADGRLPVRLPGPHGAHHRSPCSLVRDQPWVADVPLGVTLVVTHLGLLFWETKFVSASLAFPGLKPSSEEQ